MIIFCLSIQTLQVPSEETVFEAVISWIKQDEMKRKDLLPKMLEFVRLPLLTPRYLTDIVDSEASTLYFEQIWLSCESACARALFSFFELFFLKKTNS